MRRITTLGPAFASLATLLLVVFGPALFRGRQFAFQDAGHFYYPLLQRVQQEWDAGRWPLWAPEASAGTPLLGNPTAAVLYPGKFVFFLLPFPWAVRAYAIGHVALAFGAMAALLRGWKVSATGATLGALAYAFGVPVLSQTSNVIFLVGAAWAPLGLMAADRLVRGGSLLALAGLASVLALEVLGGDPEAAYLTVICVVGYAAAIAWARSPRSRGGRLLRLVAWSGLAYLGLMALSWWSARIVQGAWATEAVKPWPWTPPRGAIVVAAWGLVAIGLARKARDESQARWFAARVTGLAGASGLALLIAGAQLLPILESAGLSFRAAEAEGFHDIYAYSAHPLQFLDAIWPNVFGTLEGGYRSWLNAMPPKPGGRLWMPSLYLGGLTLVLAVAGVGGRPGGESPWRAWLVVVAVASGLAGLGYHASPMLWARCVPGGAVALGPIEPPFSWHVRSDGQLRDADGGVYWLLASAFPGFGSFRYPPKLFVFWSLAVSGLAGAGWDRLASGEARRAARVAAFLLAASLVALVVSWLGAAPIRAWFDHLAGRLATSDEPLDAARAIAEARAALGHGAAVAAFALGVAILAPRRPRLAGLLAVAGLAIDLGVANASHVVTVPQAAFEEIPRALEEIREAERTSPAPGSYRVARVGRWWPTSWIDPGGAPRRFETITRWERDTLRPNYQMPLGVRSTFHFDTMEPLDYGLFFLPWSLDPDPATVAARKLGPGQKVWYFPRRGFDLWNTRYFIVPARLNWDSPARGYAAMVPDATFLYPKPGTFDGPDGPALRKHWGATEDFRILRNEAAFPRAWVVHRAYLLDPIRGTSLADRNKVMQEILYQGDEFWRLPGVSPRDPRSVAWIETDRPKEVDAFLSRADPDPAETVVVTRDEPQIVEMTATLVSPGLVVVADQFYPGWTLTVDGRPAEILRTNRAMRGVVLPSGTHRLAFRYEPRSFRLGLILSALGVAALMMFVSCGTAKAARNHARGFVPPG